MPVLQFYISPDQLTQDEKNDIATKITAFYAQFFPAFFVDIIFNEIKSGSFFVGGKCAENNFVRLTIEHIAVNWKGDSDKAKGFLDWMSGFMSDSFGKNKGWTWEYNIVETPRDLWRINGYVVPPLGSQAIKTWEEAGKGIPWEG